MAANLTHDIVLAFLSQMCALVQQNNRNQFCTDGNKAVDIIPRSISGHRAISEYGVATQQIGKFEDTYHKPLHRYSTSCRYSPPKHF